VGKSTGFTFKQFHVQHERCAMKVGTDGVLLGCWTDVPADGRILDIGTGSGLIALMIAQRTDAEIDAIDIASDAYEQACFNFAQSPWNERLKAHISSIQEWQCEEQYDLIVSNPPYFNNSLKNPDKGRELARHTDSLSYAELIAHSVRVLKETGRLSIILPAEEERTVCTIADAHGLYLSRVTRVYSKESKPMRRVLLSWVKQADGDVREDKLVLENAEGGRSTQYQELAKDFYL
jgi:tRNA1Val (adenine37-N6)-methyltransferase